MVKGGSSKTSHKYSSYKKPLYEKPIFHYTMFILVIAALVMSIFALVNINEIKKSLPTTANTDDLLAKLTSHEEMKNYVDIAPLNIIQINNDNLANLQAQINGLDTSFVGFFIVQYTDAIVIYDYDNDEIKGTISLQQQQAQLPADFFAKLNKHPELQGLENEQPVGGQIDTASLEALKQQSPNVYANAKVGDFLLRYSTKLIIYDYNQDKIINTVNLG
jgi:hypothetical protein